jgi:triphosphoribosyl-dephospho-CoA synthase
MTPERIAAAAQLACLLEASAPKPGNVSPGHPFHDTTFEDFAASAAAIGPAFLRAGTRAVGDTIVDAVRATRGWTRANTNLGIVLLLAPLARAASVGGPLPAAVRAVLAATTVHDAELAYEAIRLAGPGGLGDAPAQDVRERPTVTLLEAMRLAAHRDVVAGEWASGYSRTFAIGAPALRAALEDGLPWGQATTEAYLALLAQVPDTLIARKLGHDAALAVSRAAAAALAEGGVRTTTGQERIAHLDADLRDPHNRRNPGATADLTAAALFVIILERQWPAAGGDRPPSRAGAT